MSRFIAFLRAINVGGHNVKMAELKRRCEALGLERVETFIASGNVIFESDEDVDALTSRIEEHLGSSLGYAVATFIRTREEVAAIVRHRPFRATELEAAGALSVGFLKQPLDRRAVHRLQALETDIDRLKVRGRELYWMCALKQSQSTISNVALEKALAVAATLRGINTLARLTAKYPPAT